MQKLAQMKNFKVLEENVKGNTYVLALGKIF